MERNRERKLQFEIMSTYLHICGKMTNAWLCHVGESLETSYASHLHIVHQYITDGHTCISVLEVSVLTHQCLWQLGGN